MLVMQVALSTPKRNNGYVAVSYCNLGIVLVKQNDLIKKQIPNTESANNRPRVTEIKRVKQH